MGVICLPEALLHPDKKIQPEQALHHSRKYLNNTHMFWNLEVLPVFTFYSLFYCFFLQLVCLRAGSFLNRNIPPTNVAGQLVYGSIICRTKAVKKNLLSKIKLKMHLIVTCRNKPFQKFLLYYGSLFSFFICLVSFT